MVWRPDDTYPSNGGCGCHYPDGHDNLLVTVPPKQWTKIFDHPNLVKFHCTRGFFCWVPLCVCFLVSLSVVEPCSCRGLWLMVMFIRSVRGAVSFVTTPTSSVFFSTGDAISTQVRKTSFKKCQISVVSRKNRRVGLWNSIGWIIYAERL